MTRTLLLGRFCRRQRALLLLWMRSNSLRYGAMLLTPTALLRCFQPVIHRAFLIMRTHSVPFVGMPQSPTVEQISNIFALVCPFNFRTSWIIKYYLFCQIVSRRLRENSNDYSTTNYSMSMMVLSSDKWCF